MVHDLTKDVYKRQVTNVVQNDADIDEEIQNAQDTVEFNISE